MCLICDFMRASTQALEECVDPIQRQRIQHHIEALEWLYEAYERQLVAQVGGSTILGLGGALHGLPLVSMN